ncbi:DUF2171 domain-containing protein [Hyalangium rubrum]|uniref:DUF2171 domain-containing protein n=1 Tax=Hyalangium rubrum TaxID=3103134 RepID=A0ABU5H9X7_9BACT|nr:DUF2171 domain-containing protein [Hyalangium sp. s54d21]MDY7230297.1 DUF2171 domain-containing protein [Hyalangium sp. s54d21]
MINEGEVREGMTVRTSDGRRLGVVAGVGETHFELEKGLVSVPRRDYLVEYRDVASVRGHSVWLEADAQLQLEEDDDGGALPPRRHEGMDGEPVNLEEPAPGP